MLDDLNIVRQLLAGNHLEGAELKRAKELVYALELEVKRRMK